MSVKKTKVTEKLEARRTSLKEIQDSHSIPVENGGSASVKETTVAERKWRFGEPHRMRLSGL